MAAAKDKKKAKVKLSNIKLQNGTERTFYVTWTWKKSHTKEYRVIWYYATGNGVFFVGSDSTEKFKQSIYTAPENATVIYVKVRPVSETRTVNNKQNQPYWTPANATSDKYKIKWRPPSKPATPDISLNEYRTSQIDVSLQNIDSAWTATHVRFVLYREDIIRAYQVSDSAILHGSAGVSFTAEDGYKYKARCYGYKNSDDNISEISDFSNEVVTRPKTPQYITSLKAMSSTSVALDWNRVSNCTSYEIQYTTEKRYFDTNPSEVKSQTIEAPGTHAELTGLESGHDYYFRVRAVNSAGNSGWSNIECTVLGKEPAAPTTWSSTTTAMVGEDLTLYWMHNSQDGSYEKNAEIELTINGVTTTQRVQNTRAEEEQGQASTYTIATGKYTEGTKIRWRVRTCGITYVYGDWSALREIDVYAQPTLSIAVCDQNGSSLPTITSFPFKLVGLVGPKTQTPIGYYVDIISNEGYETVDQVGITEYISAGDSIYSKYLNSAEDLNLEFSADNIDLEDGISYTVTVVVSMNSGLSVTANTSFSVSWAEEIDDPDAEIGYDPATYSCNIRPYCTDEEENLVDDVILSVYRREYDGEFVEIASGLSNSETHYITDPHPALDYARYRIVAMEKTTGAISYYDPPGYPIDEHAAIIQWSEQWSEYDASDVDEADATATPTWTGSLVRLPYNIDVSDKTDPDVELVKYIGRKRPVSYYGTQLGATATWKMDIPAYDKETLYALRRLQAWTGNVYAREPSGSGYWANVKVSFSQTHCSVVIPVTIDLTRVEGGV